MTTLIPTIFEISCIRDAVQMAINFDSDSRMFKDIEVNLHKDIVCVVDVLATCWQSDGTRHEKAEIIDAIAVDIYNDEFEVDIKGICKL